MTEYQIKRPEFVGLWTSSKAEVKRGVFLVYLGADLNRGRIFDDLGVSTFESVTTEDYIKFTKEYARGSLGDPGKIIYSGRLLPETNFFEGTWCREEGSEGKFVMTDFRNAGRGDNKLAQELLKDEVNRLHCALVKLTNESPFLPPVPEALVSADRII